MIGYLLTFIGGIALVVLALSLKNWRRFYLPNWLLRALGETPWAPGLARHMRAVSNSSLQPTHEVYFVPRQEIAECGLKCTKCGGDVAERGDFSQVLRSMVDGQENEVIKCRNMVDFGDGRPPVQCLAWLAASPNTEHGDELIEGDPPEFYRFNRITTAQALREKYGVDVSADAEGGIMAGAGARPEGAVPKKDDVLIVPFAEVIAMGQQAERERLKLQMAAAPSHPAVPPNQEDTRILPTLKE